MNIHEVSYKWICDKHARDENHEPGNKSYRDISLSQVTTKKIAYSCYDGTVRSTCVPPWESAICYVKISNVKFIIGL